MKPNSFNEKLWHHMYQTAPRPEHVKAEHVKAEPFDKFHAENEALWYEMAMRQVIATPRLTIEQLQLRPVDMVLHCPKCGKLHIDVPDPLSVELWDVPDLGMTPPDEYAERIARMTAHDAKCWLNPPHKTHLCRTDQGGCGNEWKPFDYPTNGVPDQA